MARKLKSIAIAPDGSKYVEMCDSGISPMVCAIDCLRLTIEKRPGGKEAVLLSVSDVLDWHQREMKHPMTDRERKKHQAFVDHFQRILDRPLTQPANPPQ